MRKKVETDKDLGNPEKYIGRQQYSNSPMR